MSTYIYRQYTNILYIVLYASEFVTVICKVKAKCVNSKLFEIQARVYFLILQQCWATTLIHQWLATLFWLSGAGITRGWTACLQSRGPVLIGQTDIECSKLSGTIRKRLEIFTVHYQGGPLWCIWCRNISSVFFRISCGKLTWNQCKEVSTSWYLSLVHRQSV